MQSFHTRHQRHPARYCHLAILPFRSHETRQDDGTWLRPIGDEVWQRIEDKRLPAESHDDSLMHIIREYRGLKPN